MKNYNYYVYITTNPKKTTLYIGVTNNLPRRLEEHFKVRGKKSSFVGRYHCYNLIYFERYENIDDAIKREKEIKKWRREKKEILIKNLNPEWKFLNEEVMLF